MNNFLEELVKSNSANELANQLNLEPEKVASITENAIPALLEGLNQSTQTDQQAQQLEVALEKHDGSGLPDLLSNMKNIDLNDGAKIASHIFNGTVNYEQVFTDFAGKFGVSSEQSKQIFDFLSPVVMQFLGKKKNETTEQTNMIDLTTDISKEFSSKDNGIDLSDIISMFTGK